MFSMVMKRLYKEFAASSIREITAHMIDHLLSGIVALVVTHQLTINVIVQLTFIGLAVLIIVRTVRNNDEDIKVIKLEDKEIKRLESESEGKK